MEYLCKEKKDPNSEAPLKNPPWQVFEGKGVIAVCANEDDGHRVAEALEFAEEFRLGNFIKRSEAEALVEKAVEEAKSSTISELFASSD